LSRTYLGQAAKARLQQLLQDTRRDYGYCLGFPAALDFNYRELTPLLHRLLNNVGDPEVESLFALTTKAMEREVLTFFAQLFRAPADKWWGYVTNGSTECNLYALYVARQKLPGAAVYYSREAHYSVPKAIHILGRTGVAIQTTSGGEMDYADLQRQLLAKGADEAIVLATIGTTMTEARDDVAKIRQAFRAAGITRSYIHSDAALAGPYAALIEPRHPFDFADGADSVSVSGHKFMGSPIPSGVVLVRKEHRDLFAAEANYTGSIDTTISGSRNGHTPLFLWYAIQRWGKAGLRLRAQRGLEVAAYTEARLNQMRWKSWRNPGALTVMLASPPADLAVKWQLATHHDWSHIICMPGITKTKIDRFLDDLARHPSYPAAKARS
jgi:histidine decarboxylase